MIEFAPNPSGPMHIGNLRTYAAAYWESVKTGEHLSIRFDDNACLGNPHNDMYWATDMLITLDKLNMSPDSWFYNTEKMHINSLPNFVKTITVDTNWDYALINEPIPDRSYISSNLSDLFAKEVDVDNIPKLHVKDHPPSIYWGMYAVRCNTVPTWKLSTQLVNVIGMQLRGVKKIVRAVDLLYVRDAHERLYNQYLNYSIPEVIYTSFVMSQNTIMAKHRLKKGDYGTVEWAIAKYGIEKVKEIILESAQKPLLKTIITIEDIFND